MCDDLSVNVLEGKILVDIQKTFDEIKFITDAGDIYKMYHEQGCCETVEIDEIIGDLKDLLNSPIIRATEDANEDQKPKDKEFDESWTWTFYNIATNKGHVTIKWYGTSNGYYSEAVSFCEVK